MLPGTALSGRRRRPGLEVAVHVETERLARRVGVLFVSGGDRERGMRARHCGDRRPQRLRGSGRSELCAGIVDQGRFGLESFERRPRAVALALRPLLVPRHGERLVGCGRPLLRVDLLGCSTLCAVVGAGLRTSEGVESIFDRRRGANRLGRGLIALS